MPNIEISPDADTLPHAPPTLILQAAREAIAARGRFTIALDRRLFARKDL